MKAVRISGTENYSEEAPELSKRYESISFADHHRSVIHLIPTVPGRVLDIGSGTGRDAAGLAGLGTQSSPSNRPKNFAAALRSCIRLL
jgi:ubiquinone/menaquinone biosynthesis C-methylase UbiE